MQYLYAWTLLLVVLISLWIVYNPLCLAPYGIERFDKQGEINSYDFPW